MYKYAISFRIDTDTHGYTYYDRHTSLMDQIRKTGAWEETTSFALTTTTETLGVFADRLYFQSHFSAIYDMMLVIDIERGVAVSRGKIEYPATLRGKLNKLIQK